MMQQETLMHKRECLIRALTDELRNIPGGTALHTFGSSARGEDDCYSDIDVQLVTIDPGHSLKALPDVLSRVAPVAVEWVITESKTSWAGTILLKGHSPYHKIDLGLCTEDADETAWILKESFRNWSQTPPEGRFSTPVPTCSRDTDSIEHMVIGELIGLTRYVKARRRNQELVCWKFFSALLNRTLLLSYVTIVDPSRSHIAPLVTHEYTELQHQLPVPLRDRLRDIMDISNAGAMDRSVVRLARMLVSASHDVAPVSDACHRETDLLLTWLQDELTVPDSI